MASGLTLTTTALYALAFVNLYASPHPWTAASRWIYDNIAPGQMILNEKWDDDLPVGLVVDGTRRSRNQYEADSLTWLSGTGRFDDEAKLGDNLTRLAEADYLSVASNRIYGVVPRLPERYPLSSQVYPLLFDGSLGYELVYVGNRGPNLAGVHLQPDTFSWPDLQPPAAVVDYLSRQAGVNWGRADESFTVYDQPLVMIFENSERLSVEEMQAHFTVWLTPP